MKICIKIHTKILFDHFLDRDCGWLYLQIGRLFPSRNGMGVFVHSDLAWVLDHYKYNDRPIEFLLFVRGTQFLSIYVWNDIELLWVQSDLGQLYPAVLRGI